MVAKAAVKAADGCNMANVAEAGLFALSTAAGGLDRVPGERRAGRRTGLTVVATF